MKKTLTLTALSQYIGIPRRTLYDMLNDGRFNVPSIPDLKPRRWNSDDVDNWLNGKKCTK